MRKLAKIIEALAELVVIGAGIVFVVVLFIPVLVVQGLTLAVALIWNHAEIYNGN